MIKKAEKVQIITRKGGNRYASDIIINGRYVGCIRMTGTEYEMFTGCFLGNEDVEMKLVEYQGS